MMRTQTLIQLLQTIERQLAVRFADPTLCQQYARWLVAALYQKNITHLLAQKNHMLSDDQQKTLDTWIMQLVDQQMPIQYLLGTVPFGNLTLTVEPPVLIPRPETETWVMQLCDQLHTLCEQPLTILDLCTGSGCIALALAQALSHATVYAVDIAPYALNLARKNAELNNLSNLVFVQADLFTGFAQQNIIFDLIVANPPYIAFDEWQQLDVSVKRWEDALALTAPDNGLAVITQIVQQAPLYLKANQRMQQNNIPQLVMEIDRTQAAAVTHLLRLAGFMHVAVAQDFSGQDRVVSARL